MEVTDRPMQWNPLEPVERVDDMPPFARRHASHSFLARTPAHVAGLLALTVQTVALTAIALLMVSR